MSTEQFRGKTAVITGAASGIGMGLAQHAAKLGMNLVLADINAAQLDQFASTLPGKIITVPTDVTDLEQVKQLAERAYATFGHVDLMFNNAGILVTGFIWEIEPARFDKNMAVNVNGVLNGIRAFIPLMLKADKPARMINTASTGGFLPSPLMSPYTASKFAVVGLTESLHYEMQMLNAKVTISLLSPGPVKSSIFSNPFGDQGARHPAVQQFVDNMLKMMDEHGVSPEEFATGVFAGIANGDYWLFPQPEYIDDALRARQDTVLQRKQPSINLY
jgi:NAD(P)-dependent dehydrogenase (short-subunit alcohol dehydrogenase family)